MINELNAAVIHDIKNQLAELALMLERRGDCTQEKAIAHGASQRLSGLLLAQLQHNGLLRASIDSACPVDLLKELAAEHKTLFPEIDIQLDTAAAPAFWFYDAALLRIALDNAMHNACRHAAEVVRLRAAERDGQLEITIDDDGAGFPPDMLNGKVGIAPVPASRNGTGLGLYLAARIAQLHQNDGKRGSIELGNNGGAIFLIRLP